MTDTNKALKLFMGNYDGKRGRAVVTSSQKKAAELIGVSLGSFRDYFSQAGRYNGDNYEILFENPHVVFVYNLSDYKNRDFKRLKP